MNRRHRRVSTSTWVGDLVGAWGFVADQVTWYLDGRRKYSVGPTWSRSLPRPWRAVR